MTNLTSWFHQMTNRYVAKSARQNQPQNLLSHSWPSFIHETGPCLSGTGGKGRIYWLQNFTAWLDDVSIELIVVPFSRSTSWKLVSETAHDSSSEQSHKCVKGLWKYAYADDIEPSATAIVVKYFLLNLAVSVPRRGAFDQERYGTVNDSLERLAFLWDKSEMNHDKLTRSKNLSIQNWIMKIKAQKKYINGMNRA
jgi:hypothetical protein